jgi:DNA-binding LacI/PurR family transcriptional regulator
METRRTKPAGTRRVTIKDVAAAVGVAVSTVSNAYNRPDQLSAALRQRIFETAEKIGYAGPNPVARGLRRGTSGLVAVLLGQPLAAAYDDSVTAATLHGITDALAESSRFGMILVPGEPAGGLPGADGVIALCPDRDDPLLTQVTRHGQPIVIVDHPQRGELANIQVNDEMAARGAIGHLTGLGHTKIGIIVDGLLGLDAPGFATGDGREGTVSRTNARLRGYRAGAEAAGLRWDTLPVYAAGANAMDTGKAAAAALLERHPELTALLGTTDQLAVGALAAARDNEIRVPERLSVVGFDDTPAARAANPPLTPVRQPHAAKGRAAAMALLAQLHDEPAPAVGRMAPKLVVRGSSAPPPS